MLLFVKALNAFQGGVLLCQRGLLVESQNLARLALQCTIYLMALTKDPGHIEAMLADYDRHKKAMRRSCCSITRTPAVVRRVKTSKRLKAGNA